MFQYHRMTGVLAACLLAAACAGMDPDVDLAAEAQAVRDRSAAWLKAVESRDISGLAAEYFMPDATSMYDGEIRHGAAEIQAGWEAELAAMPDVTLRWTTTSVNVAASGDLAYECGNFAFDPDGAGEAPEQRGEYVTVWTKSDGTWRVAADAGTVARPAEAEPAAEAATEA